MRKTKDMLIIELEDMEERLNIAQQDVDYYAEQEYKLHKQKFALIKWLEENNYTEVIKKIEELEK